MNLETSIALLVMASLVFFTAIAVFVNPVGLFKEHVWARSQVVLRDRTIRRKTARGIASIEPAQLPQAAITSIADTSPSAAMRENSKSWATEPNSETLVLLLGCLSAISDLKSFKGKEHLSGRWMYNPEPDLSTPWGKPLYQICLDDFVIRDGGSIQGGKYSSSSEQPSLQGIDIVLRVLSHYKDFVPDDWQAATAAAINGLTGEFYDKERHLFRLKPEEDGSVFGTFSAMGVIWNTQRYLDPDQRKQLALFVEDLSKPLLSPTHGKLEDGIFGYHIGDGGKPCLSTTEYVYRIGMFQRDFLKQQTELFSHLEKNKTAIVRLVQKCQRGGGAGFSRYPFDDTDNPPNPPTPAHTRHACQLLRAMLWDGLIEYEQLNWLRPTQILEFLLECHSGNGFANTPFEIPSLFASRAAINVAKLLEIYRLNGVFPDDTKGYDHYRWKLMPYFLGLREFAKDCYDPDIRSYWPFPKKYHTRASD